MCFIQVFIVQIISYPYFSPISVNYSIIEDHDGTALCMPHWNLAHCIAMVTPPRKEVRQA